MTQFPFYAYPDFPHSFYVPSAETAYLRPRRPSPPSAAPTPTPRSVINVPVFDSSPSWPSSSPAQPHPLNPHHSSPPPLNSRALPSIDLSSAATLIQSHFRGLCVRKHQPLLHLRSIAKARKQLQDLQLELESPEFILKIRASEKECLRFSESIMAIILRLDAVEGSIAEVRSQRKEVTRMAIKLQDAVDAIMRQEEDVVDLNPTHSVLSEVGMVPDNDNVLCEKSEELLCSDVSPVGHTISKEAITGFSALEEDPTSPGANVADRSLQNHNKEDVVDMLDENVLSLGAEYTDCPREPGLSDCFESTAKATVVETTHEAEQDFACVTGETVGNDVNHAAEEEESNDMDALHLVNHTAEEEVSNDIDALHLGAQKDHMQENVLKAKVDHGPSVCDTIIVSRDAAEAGTSDGSCMSTTVVKEVKEGLNQDVELCSGNATVEEKCNYLDYNNVENQKQLQDPSIALERLTEEKCSSCEKGYPILHEHGCTMCSNGAHENCSNEETHFSSSAKDTCCYPHNPETRSSPDSALLLQLSNDCRQLKSLVGKLVVQNKAQSKLLWALGERLELLEHQQKINSHQRNQQKTLKKRNSKKGLKRSIKCSDFE